jgi:hypothetical protein
LGGSKGGEVAFSITGGARIGWVNASWPFARLSVSSNSLTVAVGMLGTYAFAPAQVVALEPYGVVPLVGRGVQVIHGHPNYPAKVVFWSFGDPERLIAKIRGTGFVPSCPSAAATSREGIPLRWSAILVALVVWNTLFLLGGFVPWRAPKFPGPLVPAALALAFLSAYALPRSTFLQSLVLKEGRSIEEIRALLSLIQLVCGLLFVVFLIVFAVGRAAG